MVPGSAARVFDRINARDSTMFVHRKLFWRDFNVSFVISTLWEYINLDWYEVFFSSFATTVTSGSVENKTFDILQVRKSLLFEA